MAKSNPSSTKTSPVAGSPKSPKRGGGQYGVGGAAVTLLLALLYWWLNGGSPGAPSTNRADASPPAAVVATTETATAAAVATATEAATVAPTATATAAPVANAPTPTRRAAKPTATAQPAPTATKPPKVKPSPTPLARAGPPGMPVITVDELPPEARDTLALIASNGPFPYERDGITFQNRERLLPPKARSYYREYTVVTPGESDRGARRVIAGANGELYYTDDHYETFYWIVTQ